MGFDDCYLLGHLVKTHGLRGELTAHFDVDFPAEYQELESVFVDQNGKLVPFFIETLSIQGNKVLIAFDDVDDIDTASQFVGSSLYLPLENLPPLPDGKYYFHQLIGLTLYDGESVVGEVKELYDLPNNRLIGVDYNGAEVLIPLTDEIIDEVNLADKKITASLPEGLLEVFTESDKDET
ncbi:MAG: ribosome maturation factor RimM [Cyclobacteriaceae bacterium]